MQKGKCGTLSLLNLVKIFFFFFLASASALGYHSGIIPGENSWIETIATNAKQKLDSGLTDVLSL